jgi:NADPH:quinone reductase-like Zn-dependent oxidoreductase
VVESTGPGVDRLAPGDRVVGLSMWFSSQVGTYAEIVVLDDSACAPAPAGVSDEAAATIPLNGLTAWSALTVSKVGPDDTLLVTGAAGAVGGYVVQLAKQRGIRVVGLGRSSDAAIIGDLGADEVIDDYAKASDVLFAIDTTGAPDLAVAAMGAGGRLVTVSGRATTAKDGVEIKSAWVRPDAAALEQLCAMAASGGLTLRLADVVPLNDAAAAHRRFGAGGVRGRIVLRTGA